MIPRLHDLHAQQFAEKLGTVVAHSRPIAEQEHLKGREKQVQSVKQAIYAAGRHVFVFGERGVGKTSLAKTVGLSVATTRDHFRQIGCASDMTFSALMAQILEVFDPERITSVARESSWNLGSFLGLAEKRIETREASGAISVSVAADALANLDNDGSNELRVVVIDEVDRLSESNGIKGQLAELLKLLGDRGARITLVFTGVGSDLTSILGSHPSAHRQLSQVPLDRLDYHSALTIVDDALACFGLNWEVEPTRSARFRIADIANGFPYYVHFLMEKLLYEVYNDRTADGITLEHLQAAIAAAVTDAQEEVRKPYDNATRGRNEVYKYVAWAAADSWNLERTASQIYSSYLGICERATINPLERDKFLQRLAAMKRDTHGSLLKAGYRKGQYSFSENFVRGYVRLCAAAEGVELNDLGPDPAPAKVSHVPNKRFIDPRRVGGAPSTLRRG